MCEEVDLYEHGDTEVLITQACGDQDLTRHSTLVTWHEEMSGDEYVGEPGGVPLKKLVRTYKPEIVAFQPVFFTDDDPDWGMRLSHRPFPQANELAGFAYLLAEDAQAAGVDPKNQKGLSRLIVRDLKIYDAFARGEVYYFEVGSDHGQLAFDGLFYGWERMTRSINSVFAKLHLPLPYKRDEN